MSKDRLKPNNKRPSETVIDFQTAFLPIQTDCRVLTQSEFAKNNREAFKDEPGRIDAHIESKNPSNYNRIKNSGKYRKQDGD